MFGRHHGLFACLLAVAGLLFLSVSCFQQTKQHGKHFYYYAQQDRVAVMESLKKAIEARYALLEIKKRRLGIQWDDIFAEAVSEEQDFPDVSSTFSQSVSNLRFLDRVQKTIARFQDTHLQSYPVLSLPTIYLGFHVREVQGRLVINRMDDRIKKLAKLNGWDLNIGDELIAIGRDSAKAQVDQLIPYISASSAPYRRARATRSLTERDFAYPTSSRVRVIFRQMQTKEIKSLSLRWKYSYEDFRVDAAYYLESRKFKYRPLDSTYGTESSKIALKDMLKQQEWYGSLEPEKLVLRTGWLGKGKKAVGVIQLYSFLEQDITQSSSLGAYVSWDEPIINFLMELKRRQKPLILDLRFNEGGHVEFPLRLMSLLAEEGKRYPSYTESYRVTHGIQQIWQRISPDDHAYLSESQTARQVQRAIKNHSSHTAIWSKTDDLRSPEELSGFNEPMVTLLSSKCVSACDIMALLLEKSGRSTLVGQGSNGTGAGYFSWEPYQATKWTDLYQIVSLDIPNMLFGQGMAVGKRENTQDDAFYQYNRENIPVIPSVIYQDQLIDLMDHSRGWRDTALQVLETTRIKKSKLKITKK